MEKLRTRHQRSRRKETEQECKGRINLTKPRIWY